MSARCRHPGEDRDFFYRCTDTECPGRVTIGALLVERLVIDETRGLAHGLVGRASGARRALEAKEQLTEAQAALERLMDRLEAAGVADEPHAIEQVARAMKERDAARIRHTGVLAEDKAAQLAINADVVLDHGSREGKRELISAVVESVVVARGKDTKRVKIRGRVV